MARIRGYSEEEVDLLITDFERTIEASILRTLTVTANNLKGAVVASSSAGLSPDDVHIITMQWADEVDGELTPYIGEVYTGSAVSVAISTAEAFPNDDLPGVPLLANENVITFMKTVTNRLVNVGDELWEDVRNELIDGINTGQSIEQIANRIVAVSQFSKQRATVIARTEVHGAAEAGSLAQISYMGYENDEVTKEWLSAHDLRTRKSHVSADGQIVQLNEMFSVGRASLRFPGDPTGPADEIIQCRCSTAYDIQEAPKFRCDSSLLSASPTGATTCITPAKPSDISHLDEYTLTIIFNTFMKAGISPAYGGAKIHKVLHATRSDLAANYPNIADAVDDMQILAVVDSKYATKKDTFGKKFFEWAQAPAGQKTLAKDPLKVKPVQAISAPIKQTEPLTPVIETITTKPADVEIALPQGLPPIAGIPSAQDIVFTGKTLGSHGAQVWLNPTTGDRWLFKPQIDFLTDLDIAMAKLQSKAKMTRPAIYKKTLQGKTGSLQFMFKSSDAWPDGSFDPMKLSRAELAILQREQIFDWMISNHDTHSGQWIRLEDGQIYGTDKGQAFKFFGYDKLSWDYVPVTPLGSDKLTYTAMWKKFVQGKDIKLQDPTKGELGTFIKQLQSVPDDEYRALLLPYASAVKKGPVLAKFLDDAVARKNNLEKDFADFWQRAMDERSKHVPITKPITPPEPPSVPKIVPPSVNVDKAYSAPTIALIHKQMIWAKWLDLGAGKKVTPAYGGAKIYKQLQELKLWAIESPTLKDLDLNELQLLNVLDDHGGFLGKPKTYKGEVMKWLELPAGKKYTQQNGGVPSSLKPSPIPPKPMSTPAPTPSVTPIVSPKAVIPDDAKEVLATGESVTIGDVQDSLSKYKNGEDIAYALTENGTIVKLVQTDGDKVKVYIKQVSKGEDTWKHDDNVFKDSITAMNDFYDIDEGIWKLKPQAAPVPSKIPGKMPYDNVTAKEINDFKHLFSANEIIATAKGYGSDWRIIAHGDGSATVEYKLFNETEWSVSAKYDKHIDIVTTQTFQLTDDVLLKKPISKQTPSFIFGKAAGDKITSSDEVWNPGNAAPGDTIAYSHAFNQDGSYVVYRLVYKKNGMLTMDVHNSLEAPNVWHHMMSFNNKVELDWIVLEKGGAGKTWYAATNTGKMPDVLKTLLSGEPAKVVQAPDKSAGPVVHVPNKTAGDHTTFTEMSQYLPLYYSGQIIATGTSFKNGAVYRLIVHNGLIVQQRKTNAGTWIQTKYAQHVYDLEYSVKWKLSDKELDQKEMKKLDKWATTNITPTPVKTPGYAPPKKSTSKKPGYYQPKPKVPFVPRANVDITPWDDTEQREIYEWFKSQDVYLGAPAQIVWNVIQKTKQHFQVKYGGKYAQLNEIEVLRIIDEQRAKKKGLPSDHAFEEQITTWLKTPEAKMWINRRIDAPVATNEIPVPMHDFDASPIPPAEQTYEIITSEQGLKNRADSHAKYGSWKTGEKAATKAYTSGVYQQWNAAIRRGDISKYRENIIAMQKAMRPSVRPMLLHRGCSFEELNDSSIISYETLLPHVNETYISRGFTSTSYGGHAAFGGQLLIEIECPIGTPMNYVADYSHIKTEREVQLPAHLVYQILSVTKVGHKTVMRVRVIGAA